MSVMTVVSFRRCRPGQRFIARLAVMNFSPSASSSQMACMISSSLAGSLTMICSPLYKIILIFRVRFTRLRRMYLRSVSIIPHLKAKINRVSLIFYRKMCFAVFHSLELRRF